MLRPLLAVTALCLLSVTPLRAQGHEAAPRANPQQLEFGLAEFPGHLALSRGTTTPWKIDEYSAKANGHEFGIRAESNGLHLFGVLFLWPEQPPMTATTCRDARLTAESIPAKAISARSTMTASSGTPIATATVTLPGKPTTLRAFVAAGQICADLSFSGALTFAPAALATLRFEPTAPPTFRSAFLYATVAWQHQDLDGAARAYRAALDHVDTSDNPQLWRRVTTDQLAMALGMQGNLQGSRAVNLAAIKRDPNYPLYYYNLACADAEEGNEADAKTHLQQAFAHRANVLPGEAMPDPATDDSFQTLMQDAGFASFVRSLNAGSQH
jgi:hypothetical protein